MCLVYGDKVCVLLLMDFDSQFVFKVICKIMWFDFEMIQLCVLWKDEYIIVLNKLLGLLS